MVAEPLVGVMSVGYCQCGCGEKTRLAPQNHTQRGWVKGEPVRFVSGHQIRQPFEERFWAKVDRQDAEDCWPWLAASGPHGHGVFGGPPRMAHRIAYELLVGPIPEGRQLHHACEHPSCVNPAHLEPLTPLEHKACHKKDRCRKGHPRTPENVRYKPNGNLVCIPCKRAADRDRLRRLRA